MSLTKVSYSLISGAYVNVLDYGADNLGVNDSAPAIQAALDTLKTVFIPDGTYQIKTTLEIYSDQTLLVSPGATIEADASELGNDPTNTSPQLPRGNPMIKNADPIGGNEDIIIRGGNWTLTSAPGIRGAAIVQFVNVDTGEISNIQGYVDPGGLYTDSAGSIFVLDSQYINVLDCRIQNSPLTHNFYVQDSSHIRIVDCDAQNSGDSTYTVNNSPYSCVVNCFAYNSGGSHISFNSPYGLVQGNTIDCGGALSVTSGHGITLGHALTTASSSYTKAIGNTLYNVRYWSGILIQESPYTKNVVVAGNSIEAFNTVTNVCYGINSDAQHSIITNNQITGCHLGIRIYGEYCTVNGNQVSECKESGIHVLSYQNTISNNTCYNNGQDGPIQAGINLAVAASDKNIVAGNMCFDTQGTKTQASGIRSVSGATQNIFSANNVIGNDTVGLIVSNNKNVISGLVTDATNISLTVQQLDELDNTGTPSVLNYSICQTTGTTAITAFVDGYAGQQITIIGRHNVTITNGTNLKLAAASNFSMTNDDVLTMLCTDGTVWVEVSRSVN